MPATSSPSPRRIMSARSRCMTGESSTIRTRVAMTLLEEVGLGSAAGQALQPGLVVALALGDGVVAQGLQALQEHPPGLREEVDLARLVVAEVLGQHADRLALQVLLGEGRVALADVGHAGQHARGAEDLALQALALRAEGEEL